MKRLANKARRRLGIPGRPAIILGPGESVELSNEVHAKLLLNKTTANWLERGILEIYDGDAPEKPVTVKKEPMAIPASVVRRKDVAQPPEPLPEGITGEGVELNHKGGGWWEVWVNGFKVTDRNVRKEEAETIASEYE